MTVMTQASGGGGRSGSLYDVIELILDRGLVIDAFVRVSLLGIEVLTVEARVVVASVDTYLRFAETARAGRSDRRERHEERVEAGPGPEGGFEVSTYVYAFTGASHPLPVDSLAGVGEGKPPLRLVRHDGLTAVVSDAPERLRAKRRDVEAHERVLETLFAAGTVLPMRFGTVAADDESLKAELASRAKRYTKLLSRLKGKVEVNVKAVHREESVLRELLLGSQELRTRSEALRASGGGSHQDKVALGERLSVALEDRRSQDAEQVVAELRPHASAVKLGPPVDGCFVNVSFLVGATDRKDFEAALSRLRRERAELMEIRLYGPLPPYSFLASGEAGD